MRLPSASSVLVRVLLVAVAGLTFYAVDHMAGMVMLFGAVFGPRLLGPHISEIRVFTIVVLVVALGLASVNAATAVLRAPEYDAGLYLAGLVHPGDVIAVAGQVDIDDLYPYLANSRIELLQWNGSGNSSGASFLLTTQAGRYIGYGLLATFNWTKTPGLVDSGYFTISRAVRSLFRLSTGTPSTSPGDLFVYRSLAGVLPGARAARTTAFTSSRGQGRSDGYPTGELPDDGPALEIDSASSPRAWPSE